MTAVIVVFVAIIVLMMIANRINVAYPIVLVLGGMAGAAILRRRGSSRGAGGRG